MVESNIAAAVSDYRFCLYRMNVLRSGPNPDDAALASVAARIERLITDYPAVRSMACRTLAELHPTTGGAIQNGSARVL